MSAEYGTDTTCQTARYRGAIVRIKELRYEKKKDIPRDVMKEMKLMRELRHDNINSFIGACVESHCIMLLTDFCHKGSLWDILDNSDIKLEPMFKASLIHDLIKAMTFLHNSDIGSHGNLRSSNCVVTSRWTLQVTDFGLHDLRDSASEFDTHVINNFNDRVGVAGDNRSNKSGNSLTFDDINGNGGGITDPLNGGDDDSSVDNALAREVFKQLWRAPELLRVDQKQVGRGTQKGMYNEHNCQF